MDTNTKIDAFYTACTDTLKTKFILAETKISTILRSIVNSPELVSVVSDALAGFNFSNEFNKIQVKNEMRRINIILPKDPHKLVAIVFSLLGEIDAHRVDFHDFIYSYFDTGNSSLSDCYDRFVATIIIPFRDTLCELVGYEPPASDDDVDGQYTDDQDDAKADDFTTSDNDYEPILPSLYDDDDKKGEDDMFDYQLDDTQYDDEPQMAQDNDVANDYRVDEFFNDIRVIFNQIRDTVSNDPRIKDDRKDDLIITLDAALQAVDFRSLKIINALMISLNDMLRFVKSTKFYNNELQNRIAQFYDEML